MFKAVFTRLIQLGQRFNRRQVRVIDLESNENIEPVIIGGKRHIFLIADKATMKIIKTAIQVQVARTTDVKYFDPVTDKEEIDLINSTAENLRQIYDSVSKDA